MDRYASHQQLLIASALQSSGPMYEMGCGDYSTPLLAEIAAHMGRTFEVYTTDRKWGSKYERLCPVNYLESWDDYPYPDAGFTFLDNEQYVRDRKLLVPRLLETSKVVICHDFGTNEWGAAHSTTLNGDPPSVVMSNSMGIKLHERPVEVPAVEKTVVEKDPINVACVYKTGGDYTAEYVERLHEGVLEHSDREVNFLVYTDSDECLPGEVVKLQEDLPGWWSKLELFREFRGRTVFFDLDTIITGPLAPLYDYDGPMALIRDFYHPDILSTGVMAWNSPMPFILPTVEEKRRIMAVPKAMDQHHIVRRLNEAKWSIDVVQNVISIASYKVHCRGKGVPAGTAIVCYHGHPRPHEVNWTI